MIQCIYCDALAGEDGLCPEHLVEHIEAAVESVGQVDPASQSNALDWGYDVLEHVKPLSLFNDLCYLAIA